LISVSSIAGTAFYFSGRNFQSMTYGEVYSKSFLTSETPNNVIGLYPGSSIAPLFQFVRSQVVEHSGSRSQIIWVTRHDYIQVDYYLTSNMTGVNGVVGYVIEFHKTKIGNNNFCLWCTNRFFDWSIDIIENMHSTTD
jgi:hypothetical protein